MTRIAPIAAVLALACQNNASKLDDKAGQPPPRAADAGITLTNPHGSPAPPIQVPPTDWDACDAALVAAPKTPAMRRVQHIVRACKPCGDWKPLLDWHIESKDGGPKRSEIEDAMLACKAYCKPDAKARFLGTLDKFRGKGNTRGPWRFIGDLCKTETSSLPDNRYASAPWFALDRIARAAGARPESAKLLEAIDIPLPVVSISGFGYELSRAPTTAPDTGPLTLTVTPNEIRIAAVSHAKLGKDGITVTHKGEPYPGALATTSKELADAIAKMGDPMIPEGASMAVFAPRAMPAIRLLDLFKLTGERPTKLLPGHIRLAVAAEGGLPGWATSGTIPIALRTTPHAESVTVELGDNPDGAIEDLKKVKLALLAILKKLKAEPETPGMPSPLVLKPALVVVLGPGAKVEGLAMLLGAAGYFDVKSVALVAGKAPTK